MKPKEAFFVIKDVQQLCITHLDQETIIWWTLAQVSSFIEHIMPARYFTTDHQYQSGISLAFLRIEKFESLFNLPDQKGKIE